MERSHKGDEKAGVGKQRKDEEEKLEEGARRQSRMQ